MAGPQKNSPQKPDPKKPDPKNPAAAPEAEQPDVEQVLFQGPLFDRECNLKANAKLVQAALVPVKQMISDALARRAHTILFEPREGRMAIRFVIDGVPYPAAAVPGQKGVAMVQVIKLLSGLDVNDRRTAQSGGIKAEFEKIPFNLMVESAPVGGNAEKVRIKVENRKVVRMKPTDIGFPDHLKAKIRGYTESRSGVVVVCGPPDTGVTTLATVILHCVDPYLYSVYNLADTKGRELINVTEFKPEPGHDLEMTFDRIGRREADVIYMNPLTVPQDTQTIFQYADRLSFIAEIPANTPAEAIKKLIEFVGVDEVIKGLRCVVTQKLIRKLCDDCKQAFRPNPLLLKKLGLPPETSVLYRAPLPPPPDDPKAQTIEELCADCDGVPYHGRIAAFEMLEMTDTMKEVIANGAEPDAIRKQMVADGQTTLQKDAIRLVAEGATSLEEVQRTFNPGGPKTRPAKARPKPPAQP
ncbi:MAG TPA: ATPase, T2SS/T4P/T4SS family [Planctomycetaceae bacterium]|nr:ATPase, T2SS/T4P/T4SS family [Planctomycetaceae bacterium]